MTDNKSMLSGILNKLLEIQEYRVNERQIRKQKSKRIAELEEENMELRQNLAVFQKSEVLCHKSFQNK